MAGEFEQFTPDDFLESVEKALDARLTGFAAALPSYINRVYELETQSGEHLVAKFYRPGRWTPDAILEEHDFLWDCEGDEIPVVPPYELSNGSTLDFAGNVPFAVFPKKRGRNAEFESEESLKRLGALIGRIHVRGASRSAEHRMRLTPEEFLFPAIGRLLDSDSVHPLYEREFLHLCDCLTDAACELLPSENFLIRIHGDFHRANVLDRPGEGLMAIDFDDMLCGPPVQDLWLLLPDRVSHSHRELDLILDTYSMFMDFDESSLCCVEVLRGLRMIHFLSWCAFQAEDRRFLESCPDWGTESFWRRELADLRNQLGFIEKESAGSY